MKNKPFIEPKSALKCEKLYKKYNAKSNAKKAISGSLIYVTLSFLIAAAIQGTVALGLSLSANSHVKDQPYYIQQYAKDLEEIQRQVEAGELTPKQANRKIRKMEGDKYIRNAAESNNDKTYSSRMTATYSLAGTMAGSAVLGLGALALKKPLENSAQKDNSNAFNYKFYYDKHFKKQDSNEEAE